MTALAIYNKLTLDERPLKNDPIQESSPRKNFFLTACRVPKKNHAHQPSKIWLHGFDAQPNRDRSQIFLP